MGARDHGSGRFFLVPFSFVLRAGVIAFQTLRLTLGRTLFHLFRSSGKPLRDGTREWNKRVLEPTQTPGVGWKRETGKMSPINWWNLISAGNKQQAFLIPGQESGMQLGRKTPRTTGDDRKGTFCCSWTPLCDTKKRVYFLNVAKKNNSAKFLKNSKEQHVSVLEPVSRGHS